MAGHRSRSLEGRATERHGSPWPLNGLDAALVAQTYAGRPMTTHHVIEIDRPLDVERLRAAAERLVEIYPDYDDYQARTTRNIPVMVLSPA